MPQFRLESPGKGAILTREERHRWDRHVRGFRSEHNFALVSGVSSGKWVVDRFGTLESRSFAGSGLFSRFQYSFHLPFHEGFGYLLGSSLGYHYESADKRQPFKPVSAVMFPGVLAGLVYNLSPAIRTSLALDVYLERHDGIEERDGTEGGAEISVTFRTYDFGLAVDIFYDLNWAIRIETHARRLEYLPPKGASEVGVIDARISKEDQWLGAGLVYHLL